MKGTYRKIKKETPQKVPKSTKTTEPATGTRGTKLLCKENKQIQKSTENIEKPKHKKYTVKLVTLREIWHLQCKFTISNMGIGLVKIDFTLLVNII